MIARFTAYLAPILSLSPRRANWARERKVTSMASTESFTTRRARWLQGGRDPGFLAPASRRSESSRRLGQTRGS